MSSNSFNKENLDTYLKELGKEYRKLNGKSMPAEVILIGGAAILANYGFRDMTTDVDALIRASSAMKDAINRVGDKHNLPYGWMNDEFLRTDSYSPKLVQYSQRYRTFSNVLKIRTVSAEYLVAMKLRSGRKYKHDLSDAVGILAEHEKRGAPITMDALRAAVENLYGSWEALPLDSRNFIEDTFRNGDYESIYVSVCEEEENSKDLLVGFQDNYPGVTTQSNVNEILATLKEKQKTRLDDQIKACENQRVVVPAEGQRDIEKDGG